MYDTILVPTDGSDPANRAVEHALALAEHYDSHVDILYCVETSRYGEPALSSAEIVLNDLEERGQALLDDLAERADNYGTEVSTCLCHGRPWEEILARADTVDADLLVIGYQGQSHSRGGKIGSTAERVVRSADRPVLTA
ncbi:universal stress protein [Natrinema limicola]|uniref:UspA domain-containing protein n=1 Tax=Natrinema limicola JCM 13563 TaxID=1230457 RepID=M0CI16_9EURY|nr:universal stress protein [Natrinema limicola]ELZ21992.1 UspA domain-containing protein [Natrinema limicola JCM 13563]